YVAGSFAISIAKCAGERAYELLHRFFESSEEEKEEGKKSNNPKIRFEMELVKENKAVRNGMGVKVVKKTTKGCVLSGEALGEKGMTAEKVGQTAAEIVMKNWRKGGCVDEFCPGQVLLYAALVKGVSKIR